MQAHRVALPHAVQQGPDRTARGPAVREKEPASHTRPSCACRSCAAALEIERAASSAPLPQQRRATPVGHACGTRAAQHVVRSAAACAPHAGLGRKRVGGLGGSWPSRLRRPGRKEGQVAIVPVARVVSGDRVLAVGVILPREARSALGPVHGPVPSSKRTQLAVDKEAVHLTLVMVGRAMVHRDGKALFA
eukprot:scaffold9141_cov70-Phaeocystis_antarctica.AAC.11